MVGRPLTALLLGLSLATTSWAQPQPVAGDLARAQEERRREAIAKARSSVGCVLVSRSKRYQEFEARSESEPPGSLGAFEPPQVLLDPRRKQLAKRLDLSDPEYIPEAIGSGIVIDRDGLILTSYHLVDGATKIYVRLAEGGSYADIHAADERADLAVLRLTDVPTGLKPMRIGDGSSVQQGDSVMCLTSSHAAGFRAGAPAATQGMISRVAVPLPGPVEEWQRTEPLHHYGTLLEIDARYSASGGAVINMEAELIGLTSGLLAITGGEDARNFAVPMDTYIRRIVGVLKRGREVEYGFLGVSLSRDDFTTGVRLGFVSQGSPADRGGIQRSDLITSVDGHAIRNRDDLFLHIGAALAGTDVRVGFIRPGLNGEQVATVKLGKFRHELTSIASRPPASVRGLQVEYSSVLMTNLGRQAIPIGVLVRELESDSPAAEAFKPHTQPGSELIITHVNGRPVADPEEFRGISEKADALRLTVRDVGRPEDGDKTITIP